MYLPPVSIEASREAVPVPHLPGGGIDLAAIETPMRALVRLTVRKDLHVSGPEFLAAPDPIFLHKLAMPFASAAARIQGRAKGRRNEQNFRIGR